MDTLRKQLKKSGNGMISQKEKESPTSDPKLEGTKSHRLSAKAHIAYLLEIS